MNDTNTVILSGNLVRDAESKIIQGLNLKVLSFTIANEKSIIKGEGYKKEVSYFDCTLMGRPAEVMEPELKKGTSVMVIGRLKQDRWEKDGKTMSKIEILANSVKLIKRIKAQQNNEEFVDDIPF